MENERIKLIAVLGLLADDGAAISCQNVGQYRSWLIKQVMAARETAPGLRDASPESAKSCCIDPAPSA